MEIVPFKSRERFFFGSVYIINTPGRRKNKQMCHVNMIKQYFDRDSSISKPITVVNTVPQESLTLSLKNQLYLNLK